MVIDNETYRARVLGNGWIAVYRELKSSESGRLRLPGRRTIVIFDLIRPGAYVMGDIEKG